MKWVYILRMAEAACYLVAMMAMAAMLTYLAWFS